MSVLDVSSTNESEYVENEIYILHNPPDYQTTGKILHVYQDGS